MTFPLYILRVTVCSEGSPRVRRDQDGTKKGNRINLQFTFTEIFLTIPSHSQQSIEAHVEDGED